jgi:hypothetical protein
MAGASVNQPTDADYQPRRRWHEDQRPIIYVVLEVKTDGGDVRRNAVRSIAAVAVSESGTPISSYVINLSAPEGSSADQRTLSRYRDHPDSWQTITANAQRPSAAIPDFIKWVQGLPGQPVAVGSPLIQISIWLETYLRRHSKHVFFRGPFEGDLLFAGGGIDLPTFVMGTTGMAYRQCVEHMLPAEWRDNRVETHKAREDAEMHAALLITMLRLRAQRGAAGQ